MAGLGAGDVAFYELNEAFASQATYCAQKLGLDAARVNPNGGAIALGHPLGATGARATATLLNELVRHRWGKVHPPQRMLWMRDERSELRRRGPLCAFSAGGGPQPHYGGSSALPVVFPLIAFSLALPRFAAPQSKAGPAARFGVVSMCIGSGMGAAAVIEQGPDAAKFYA